jgi:hypothetical protein
MIELPRCDDCGRIAEIGVYVPDADDPEAPPTLVANYCITCWDKRKDNPPPS